MLIAICISLGLHESSALFFKMPKREGSLTLQSMLLLHKILLWFVYLLSLMILLSHFMVSTHIISKKKRGSKIMRNWYQ